MSGSVRTAFAPVAQVIVLVLLLSACQSGPSTDAEATSGATSAPHRAACVVADPEGEVILEPGTITPTTDVELVDASLIAPEAISAVERSVVAFGGRADLQGIVLDYPPLKSAGLADSLADWHERRPLRGLGLTPEVGQQAVLVAVRLDDPATPGHLDGVRVTSRAAAGAHDEQLLQPVLVLPHGDICTAADSDSTLAWVPW